MHLSADYLVGLVHLQEDECSADTRLAQSEVRAYPTSVISHSAHIHGII